MMSTFSIKTYSKDQYYQLYQYSTICISKHKEEKGLISTFHFYLQKDISKGQVNIKSF